MSNKTLARNRIDDWRRSEEYDLSDAYKSHSTAKDRAWRYCEDLCERFKGRELKVISHNTFVFTAGFEYVDTKTGKKMFMFIAPTHDTAVEL